MVMSGWSFSNAATSAFQSRNSSAWAPTGWQSTVMTTLPAASFPSLLLEQAAIPNPRPAASVNGGRLSSRGANFRKECLITCARLPYPCAMARSSPRRLAEVAQKVGLSEATVSRVLNGKAGVSEATREAVLSALDVLGYERPTQLRGVRARLIGLVLPELQNPIFPALAEVVGGALAQRGLTPVLCTRT